MTLLISPNDATASDFDALFTINQAIKIDPTEFGIVLDSFCWSTCCEANVNCGSTSAPAEGRSPQAHSPVQREEPRKLSERVACSGVNGNPLIAIHSWRGESHNYARLSMALGDQLIYSLRHPDPDGGSLPRRVDEWVEYHRQSLALAGAEPPFGGVLAVELARRLLEEGNDVSYVGLIDTTRPRLKPLSTQQFFWSHMEEAARMESHERVPYLLANSKFLLARAFPRVARLRFRALQVAGRRGPKATSSAARPPDSLTASIHLAYLNYKGDAVPYPVHLYATESSTIRAQGPALRWLPWMHGGYTLDPIAGEHLTIFTDEHIDSLAVSMRPHLEGSE